MKPTAPQPGYPNQPAPYPRAMLQSKIFSSQESTECELLQVQVYLNGQGVL